MGRGKPDNIVTDFRRFEAYSSQKEKQEPQQGDGGGPKTQSIPTKINCVISPLNNAVLGFRGNHAAAASVSLPIEVGVGGKGGGAQGGGGGGSTE